MEGVECAGPKFEFRVLCDVEQRKQKIIFLFKIKSFGKQKYIPCVHFIILDR